MPKDALADLLESGDLEHTYTAPEPAPPKQHRAIDWVVADLDPPPEIGVPAEAPEYDEVTLARFVFPDGKVLVVDYDGTVHRSTIDE